MPSNYERLRGMFESNADVEPSSDEGRQQILEAITEGRTAAFVSEAEQVQTLAALGYGRGAVADALGLEPREVDELAGERIDHIRMAMRGER